MWRKKNAKQSEGGKHFYSFATFASFARHIFSTENNLASGDVFPQNFPARMKAKIIITPKKAVVDPQGKTVQTALEHMGHRGIKAVHVGKYLEIELDATDKEAARKSLDEAAHKFLSNPVIEDYRLEIE
jgi:phosphoribosylformylglycinamidine synthase